MVTRSISQSDHAFGKIYFLEQEPIFFQFFLDLDLDLVFVFGITVCETTGAIGKFVAINVNSIVVG